MTPEMLVRRLDEAQAALAREVLATPRGRDSFEYGRVVGLYEGYEVAKRLVTSLFEESARGKFDI